MITNGGYGGVQNALAHGVPLIVAGTTEDKAEVSARVAWSGAGLNLKTKTPSVDQIWTAVQRLQKEPSFRQKAQLIAAEMGQHDGPLEAAILLEELISTRRPILTGAPLNQELPPTVNPEKMTTSSGMFQREGHFYWYL
jgi:UDP:flavonoid glycosyltransferase YjiC (YdhE family)